MTDLEKKREEINALIHQLFKVDENGQKLLEELKKLFVHLPAYPIAGKAQIDQFGGDNGIYTGFKAGQANVVMWIESRIRAFENDKKPNVIENV